MRKIIPITDLQRQSSQIVSGLAESNEPVIITQRGRVAAVLISAAQYARIEEDLSRLDELELLHLLERGAEDFKRDRTITHEEVRSRLEKKHGLGQSRRRKAR